MNTVRRFLKYRLFFEKILLNHQGGNCIAKGIELLDLSKKARLILSEKDCQLSQKEISLLKTIANGTAITSKQIHFFLTVQDKYQAYLSRNIRYNYDNMLEFIEKLEKYLEL